MITQIPSDLDPAVSRLDLLRFQLSPVVRLQSFAPNGGGEDLEYRRFLSLKQWYPNQLLVPRGAALQLWQAHILDTRAYRSDCEAVFGRFIDHFPYLGAESDADRRELHLAEQLYRELYARHFGTPSGVEVAG